METRAACRVERRACDAGRGAGRRACDAGRGAGRRACDAGRGEGREAGGRWTAVSQAACTGRARRKAGGGSHAAPACRRRARRRWACLRAPAAGWRRRGSGSRARACRDGRAPG
eukprot:scaffold54889_cov44-Phaeocystis_antarctica.AAC.4